MDDATVWAYVDQQRVDLADFLDTLTPQQWRTPSLCEGWTVREVAVHIVQSTASRPRLVFELLRSGFRFNAMIFRVARDPRTPQEIAEAMRALVGNRRRPPGTAVADPLMDILVHGQDIAIPLGVERAMPIPAAVIAANRLWTMGFPFNARKRFPQTRFVATDADFSIGEGTEVPGRIQDIVMTLAGRPAALPLHQQGNSERGRRV